jgi:hypothetical protein
MTEITEERLKEAGFVFQDLGDEPPYDMWEKGNVQIWDYNGEYWIIECLDQYGIDAKFHYMEELSTFFLATQQEW